MLIILNAMLRPVYAVRAFVFAAWILCFFSCTDTQTVTSLRREKLFHLNYGRFEDELDMFDLDSPVAPNVYLCMQDGFFFITNGGAKKIMQLTSYGDLLSVWYNSETNATPSFVNADSGHPSAMATQQAIPHPFNTLGRIAVDSRKYMYVADQLPPERQEQNREKRLLLREVVLRFAGDGSFIDYLGQEGPGGTPFPYIKNLYTTKNNELVVLSQTGTGSLVNWYSPEGTLMHTVPVDMENLLSPYNDDGQLYMSLETIVPDYNEKILYLKIDYYRPQIDASSSVQAGISYEGTYVYPLDVRTGVYGEPLRVPPFEEIEKDGFTQTSYAKSYELLGVTESGWFFFIAPDSTGYTVEMIQKDGQRIIKKHLDVSPDEMMYNTLFVSKDGIICALLATPYEASVVWWRTDAFIGEIRR